MEKSNKSSSLIGCMLICYNAASDPQACFACTLSNIIQELFSFFLYFFRPIFRSSSNALTCLRISLKESFRPTPEITYTNSHTNIYVEKDGFSIGREDIDVVMKRLGMCLDEEDFRENIGLKGVLGLFKEDEPKMEEIKQAFDVFDENGDGFIDENELKRIIEDLSFGEASEEECRRMIKTFDNDRDGKISVGEFVKLLEHTFSN